MIGLLLFCMCALGLCMLMGGESDEEKHFGVIVTVAGIIALFIWYTTL